MRICATVVAATFLTGCDENGEFAFPAASNEAPAAVENTAVPRQTTTTEEDVERPDLFEVNDRGLWDGRPSLGGAWVAHPDVKGPERALIRNVATGETVIGALFRRERENPGPLLQVSSDVAEELGILPGSPTELYVVALRRAEVIVEEEDQDGPNPVVADLETPVNVETTPLDAEPPTVDPIAGAAAAIDAAEEAAAPVVATALPAAGAVAAAVVDEPDDAEPAVKVAAVPAPELTTLDGPKVQIGVFSVEPNANAAADRLRAIGIATQVNAQEVGGRTVWAVISGVSEEAKDRDNELARIKELGFVDAFVLDS